MHIGFDISQTGASKAGCGHYAHALAKGLSTLDNANTYSFYPSFGDFYFDRRMPMDNPYGRKGDHYGPRHLTAAGAGEFWTAPDLERQLRNPDVVHANNFWCPTQLTEARLIYTLYDLGFAIEPSWTTEANRVGCFNGVFRSAAFADWIVAISESSKRDYLATFPAFPEDRIRVIHPGSRFTTTDVEGRRPETVPAGTPFWLSVGTIEPRKNQMRLVEAYRTYAAGAASPYPLVLAGGKGWLMDNFSDELDAGEPGTVILTGYVSDDELVWLYRNCWANLYPSYFEGFGLPVLEGMQFGAPTVCSNTSSLPEVAGDAAVLLAPDDTQAWAAAMQALAVDAARREQLAAAALTRAAQFDWKDSTTRLMDLYAEAMSAPKRRAASA